MNVGEARSVLERLLYRIAPEVDLADVDETASIQAELDLDSMDFLDLVTGLYEEIDLDVPEADYPALSSVAGFVSYVVAHAPG